MPMPQAPDYLELANVPPPLSIRDFLCECFFESPAQLESTRYRGSFDACCFGPVNQRLGFAIKGDVSSRACIAILFRLCRPSDIARLIVAIIVNTIQRVTFFAIIRQSRNMIVECFEIMPPFGVHRDSSSAPACVVLAARIRATENYAFPCSIQMVIPHSVRGVYLYCALRVKAATGLSSFTTKPVSIRFGHVAAVALTKPNDVLELISCDGANRKQPTETLPGHIFSRGAKLNKLWNWGIMGLHRNLNFLCLIRRRVDARWPVFSRSRLVQL
jgi:hypothetical protein